VYLVDGTLQVVPLLLRASVRARSERSRGRSGHGGAAIEDTQQSSDIKFRCLHWAHTIPLEIRSAPAIPGRCLFRIRAGGEPRASERFRRNRRAEADPPPVTEEIVLTCAAEALFRRPTHFARRVSLRLGIFQADRRFTRREIPASVAMVFVAGPGDVDRPGLWVRLCLRGGLRWNRQRHWAQ